MLYAVCTRCSFLRAFSEKADDRTAPQGCPACGGELMIRRSEGRFPPTYVSRVSLDLLSTPELLPEHARRG